MVSGQTGWYGWMGGLEEWVDGWTRGMGGMCTEMGSSIVMYNLGVGPSFAYVSASDRPQNNKLPWGPF